MLKLFKLDLLDVKSSKHDFKIVIIFFFQKLGFDISSQLNYIHYENTPIQIYEKISPLKIENFQIKKNSDIFHIPAQNTDCGYSLEPPRRGGSNEYTQSMIF